MFTISLCMIVKNESEVLGRILNCAKEFADEIIVVDTGSTDNTIEIAKQFTDKIFQFKWVDNFAKARNFAFSKATCDYQMWLDADDFITKENIEKINNLKSSSKTADVFMFKYAVGFNENDVPFFIYDRERLLKRTSNFVWEGFVHEAISVSGIVEYEPIEIQHRKISEGDPKRNLKLYQKAKKQGLIFNPREIYYYSRELYYNNYITSAIKNLKKYIKIKNSYPPDNYGARLILSECYVIKNDFENAKKCLFECIDNHLPTAEICCKLGNIYDKQTKIKEAIFWYNSACICEKQTLGFVRQDYENIIPYLELTKLYYQNGDFDTSKKFHYLAKETNSNHPSVLFNNKFFD